MYLNIYLYKQKYSYKHLKQGCIIEKYLQIHCFNRVQPKFNQASKSIYHMKLSNRKRKNKKKRKDNLPIGTAEKNIVIAVHEKRMTTFLGHSFEKQLF